MLDRIPTPGQEGRVLVTPEDGNASFYAKIQMADNPTQEGTPLSKATLLQDATAVLFGLNMDAVPDDVLQLLGGIQRFQRGLGNEYVWEKYKSTTINTPMYTTSEDTTESWNTSHGSTTIYCGDTFDIVNRDGTYYFRFSNYSTVTIPQGVTNASQVSALKGKYYMVYPTVVDNTPVSDYVKFMPSNATISVSNKVWSASPIIQYSKPFIKTETFINEHSYVNSPDSTAYPIDDGFTYKALGQLGNKAQIATGSYTGTGTYGADNPNSLTFDFEPKAVFISSKGHGAIFFLKDQPGAPGFGWDLYFNQITFTNNVVSWWSEESAVAQMNNSDVVYYYVAIG